MRISTFLPHVGVFGGVRRFIELGNAWVEAGHDVTLYVPEGRPPDWLAFRGRVLPLAASAADAVDLAVCADPHTFDAFEAQRATRHLYYCVIEKDAALARAVADRRMLLAANSTPLRATLARAAGRSVLDGVGGIRLEQFHPAPERRAGNALRVVLNGRRSRKKKGTDLILKALARLPRDLPPVEVVLFDALEPHNRQDPRPGAPLPSGPPIAGARFVMNPSQAELAELYQSADLFIAAERKAGWCNTALEAMACGAAVVCTRSGTTDFARHEKNAMVTWRHPFFIRRAAVRLMRDPALRRRLGDEAARDVRPWAWDRLAAKLLAQVAAA